MTKLKQNLRENIKDACAFIEKEQYVLAEKASGFKVGDRVRVVESAERCECGWQNSWTGEMTDAIGKVFTIIKLNSDGGTGIVLNSKYEPGYPFFVLEKVEDIKVNLNADYAAVCDVNGFQVGCQTFTWDVLDKLSTARNRLTR